MVLALSSFPESFDSIIARHKMDRCMFLMQQVHFLDHAHVSRRLIFVVLDSLRRIDRMRVARDFTERPNHAPSYRVNAPQIFGRLRDHRDQYVTLPKLFHQICAGNPGIYAGEG